MKLLQKFGKNKGFIFSMDALIGLMIVIMVLTAANIFISRIEFSSLAELQLIKRSDDLFKILNEKTYIMGGQSPNSYETTALEYLTLNEVVIYNNDINPYINAIITQAGGAPPSSPTIDLRMSINATCAKNSGGTGNFLVYMPRYSSLPENFILPKDRFVAAGQRIFVVPVRNVPIQTMYCLGDIRSWLP